MKHEPLLEQLIEQAAKQGATYAEARYGRSARDTHVLSSGSLVGNSHSTSSGFGLRVLVDGEWGFAAASERAWDAAALVSTAVGLAREAAASGGGSVTLAPQRAIQADASVVGAIDPSEVSIEERVELLRGIHEALMTVDGISATKGQMDIHREYMELATSEGSRISQTLDVVGGGYVAMAEGHGRRAARSFPHHGGWDYSTAGFEYFQRPWFTDSAVRIAEEAVLLLTAEECPSTRTTVVLDPAMIGTALHETVGHATELDRILGDERDNFGSSFVTAERIGSFPYASSSVSVAADATHPGGAGSYAFDAEGVPAQRVPLIENGILVGATNSREYAQVVGTGSNGTARASSWNRIPMARMTNVVLEPGDSTLEGLIADVDEGVYISTDAMTDIDDNRELCSFGGEIGWRIRRGELAEPLVRPYLYTDSHALLRGCDGVGSADESWVTGILGCGKGQPWQFIFTGQGGPPARFRNVDVGPPV